MLTAFLQRVPTVNIHKDKQKEFLILIYNLSRTWSCQLRNDTLSSQHPLTKNGLHQEHHNWIERRPFEEMVVQNSKMRHKYFPILSDIWYMNRENHMIIHDNPLSIGVFFPKKNIRLHDKGCRYDMNIIYIYILYYIYIYIIIIIM